MTPCPFRPSAGILLGAMSTVCLACPAWAAEPSFISASASASRLLAEVRHDVISPANDPFGIEDMPKKQDAVPDDAYAASKSYAVPALQILGFQFALNRFDNLFVGPEYDVSLSSIRRNLRSSWVTDQDPFLINQFGHPYQGSVYYGVARSSGLNFWESFGYTFAGSAVWEIAGETTPPSRNDQITTSFAGTFLGESLFRMAHLVIERGSGLSPEAREWAAAAISPPTGFNRLFFPERTKRLVDLRDPAIFSRLQIGASSTRKHTPGGSTSVNQHDEAVADFLLDYGLPSKQEYEYRQPWDYFSFQARLSTARPLESINTRGLILGAPYKVGTGYRGILGVYGSYDYLAPQLFRLSSTGLSLGTTGHWQMSRSVSLQGTATAGVGYTSTGTIRNALGRANPEERDYNYGFAPQAQLALRLLFGNIAALELNARKYFADDLENSTHGGRDDVFRGDASVIWRFYRSHELSLKYVTSRRDISVPGIAERSQRRDTLGLYYTFLTSDK